MSAFEEKLNRQARERMARIRARASSLIPYVPPALDNGDGFPPPSRTSATEDEVGDRRASASRDLALNRRQEDDDRPRVGFADDG